MSQFLLFVLYHETLHTPKEESYLSAHVCLFVCLFVRLSARLLKKLQSNYDEIFGGVGVVQGTIDSVKSLVAVWITIRIVSGSES